MSTQWIPEGRLITMYSEERRHAIMARMQDHGRASTLDLADEFDVTSETVRKDLIALEQLGLIKRTHGGAIAATRGGFELNSPAVPELHAAEKAAIMRRAAAYVTDMSTVLIDHGTTTSSLPRFIPYDIELRVVTNSLQIQNAFLDHPKVTMMSTGGILRPNAQSYVGPWAVRCIQEINVDIAIMGTAGLSTGHGLTASDVLDADVKQHMIRATKFLVMVADSSKIGRDQFDRFGSLDEIDVLITDNGIDSRHLAALRERIATVEIVEPD